MILHALIVLISGNLWTLEVLDWGTISWVQLWGVGLWVLSGSCSLLGGWTGAYKSLLVGVSSIVPLEGSVS